MRGIYPFGTPVGVVRSPASGPRKAFVLGVYPSAIHARWSGPDGSVVSAALAVADEPEPFWDGADSRDRIAALSARVAPDVGSLEDAGEHNGRAGRTLDEHYLEPLELSRDDVWIADLQNYYLASTGQMERIRASYEPLVEAGLAPPAQLTARADRPSITELAGDRDPPLEQEWAEASPDWLITLGDEPVGVLGLADLREGEYGQPRRTRVFGREVWHLALVHTRQAGGHGAHSAEWRTRHLEWAGSLRDAPPTWRQDI